MQDNLVDRLASQVFESVKTYFAKRETDLLALFQKSEEAMAKRHAQSLEGLALIVERAVTAAVAAIPAPKEGPAGPPGAPGPAGCVDKDEVLLTLKELVRSLPPAPQGPPGKDFDPALVGVEVAAALPSLRDGLLSQLKELVADAFSQLPVPKNGKDAEPVDLAALHRFVVDVVDAQVKNIVVPEGKPGASVTLEDVAPLVGETVRREVAEVALPALRDALSQSVAELPKPVDGKSVSLEEVLPIVDAAVAKQFEDLARERASATPTAASEVDYEKIFEQVNEYIIRSVDDALAAIPKPTNGKDADPALVAKMVEEAVAAIEVVLPDPIPGKDGTSVDPEQVRAMVKGEVAQAILALPKEKTADLEAIKLMVDLAVTHYLASMPSPPAGKDGLSVKDFRAELLADERTLRFSLAGGDEAQVSEVVLPMVISRDAYESGKEYVRGDSVAWDGSWWVAKRATSAVPGTGDSWKLMAQRGRNGKDREVALKEKELTQVRLK